MRRSRKVVCFSICFLFLNLFSSIVIADGCMFIPAVDEWMATPEENQIGLIEYDQNTEKLIIGIHVLNSSLQSDQAFWIFPVPSSPDLVSIDIIKEIEFLRGRNVTGIARNSIDDTHTFMSFSQPMFIPLWVFMMYSMIGTGSYDQVIVFEHLEKMGLTTELIGTNDSEAFLAYLQEHGVNVSNETLSLFHEYIGLDYCFVVSWISDVDTFRDEALIEDDEYRWYYGYEQPFFMLGVQITFPTDTIYYPLKLTSIYDEKTIPVLLQIHGFVKPLEPYNHLYRNYAIDEGTQYTEITLRMKSRDLKEDLLLEPGAPVSIMTAGILSQYVIPIGLLLFLFSSCLASLCAGIIVYHKQKPSPLRFALLGLSNILSVIGLFLLSFLINIDTNFVKIPLKQKNQEPIRSTSEFQIWGTISIIIGIIIITTFLFNSDTNLFLFLVLVLPIYTFVLLLGFGLRKSKRITAFSFLFSFLFLIFFYLCFSFLGSLI